MTYPIYKLPARKQKRCDATGRLRTQVWMEAALVESGFATATALERHLQRLVDELESDRLHPVHDEVRYITGTCRNHLSGTTSANPRSVFRMEWAVPGTDAVYSHKSWQALRHLQEDDIWLAIDADLLAKDSIRHRCRTRTSVRLREILRGLMDVHHLTEAQDWFGDLVSRLSADLRGNHSHYAPEGFRALWTAFLALGLNKRWSGAAYLYLRYFQQHLAAWLDLRLVPDNVDVFVGLSELARQEPMDARYGRLTSIVALHRLLKDAQSKP